MNGVFLDGLSLTVKGVPQVEEFERDFIFHITELLGGVVDYRESGGKGYPKTALITGVLPNGFDWTVYCAYGSRNFRQHMNIEAKGQITEKFRDAFLSLNLDWSLSRADIALDMIMDYEEGHEICKQYSFRKNIKTSLVGDWEGKTRGRTYYMGASRSASECYLRFYEKGIEMAQKGFDGYPPDLVRLELEFKPRKEKRQNITSLEADYLLSISRNPLELFSTFADLGIEGLRINGKKESSYRESIEHMLNQYSNQIKEWGEKEGINSLLQKIVDISKGQ